MSATDWNELDGYEALVSELRANPPVAPERLRQRVLAGAPGSRRRMSKRRRLVFVVVPVAVALALGAALVHGFVSSGSKPRTDHAALAQSITSLHGASHGGGAATTTPSAARELAPVFKSASGKTVLHAANVPGRPLDALTIPKNRLVHADATLQVQVKNHAALSEQTNRATQIVASLGGYAQSVQYRSERKGGNAFLDLRVPVGKTETAIAKLEMLGKLVSQQLSTQDLQQQLTRQTNQLGTLRRAIAVYEQALKSGTLSATERVEIQIKLANAQHSVRQLRKARSQTVASGATADISLTLTTHKGGAIGGGHHKSGRFDRLLGSAGDFLALEGIIVLYALIVVGPLLLLGGLAWWIVRERRRREETRLLASA
ncbi:MAG TPA: DUF4349 domain-containing protein [Gaiellaceae bacterium]|nr:DUF4349 domain-containing protein [Gaiellaceae bacterium]